MAELHRGDVRNDVSYAEQLQVYYSSNHKYSHRLLVKKFVKLS